MTSTTPRPTAAPTVVGIVPHTHWDREWYKPAVRFRQELVALVDDLTDAPPADGDGKAVGVRRDLLERARQQAPFVHVGRDERVNRRRVLRARAP